MLKEGIELLEGIGILKEGIVLLEEIGILKDGIEVFEGIGILKDGIGLLEGMVKGRVRFSEGSSLKEEDDIAGEV
jgi:hypothetical protein